MGAPWENDPVVPQKQVQPVPGRRGVILVDPTVAADQARADARLDLERHGSDRADAAAERQATAAELAARTAGLSPGFMWDNSGPSPRAVPIPGDPNAAKAMAAQKSAQIALDVTNNAIRSANQLLKHRGLGASVGSGFDPAYIFSHNLLPGGKGEAWGGTDAADFEAKLDTLKAQTFLPMVQALRGMGALSDAEGKKLTDAVAALDPNMSEGGFKSSLTQLIQDLSFYRDRAAQALGEQGQRQDGGTTGGDNTGGGTPPPVLPQMRGGFPVGTEVTFSGQEGGFDRRKYLTAVLGITPEQEAQIIGFMDANRGNQAFNADMLRAEYRRIGAAPPDEAGLARNAEEVRKGYAHSSIDTSALEKAYNDKIAALVKEREGVTGGADAAVRGVADTATLGLADKTSALVNTLFSGGTYTDNLAAERMINEADQQGHSIPRIGGQVAGGFALPMGVGGDLVSMAKTGAGIGFAHGFNSGDGTFGERVMGGLGEGAIGAASPLLFKGVGALRAGGRSLSPKQAERAALAQAAERQDISIMPADVGGPTVRTLTSGAASAPVSAAPVVKAAQRTVETARIARDRIASGVGEAMEVEGAGQVAIKGASDFMATQGARVNRLYDRARALSSGVKVKLHNARATLDRNIAELRQTPGGAEGLRQLQALRDEMDGVWTPSGIRNMRTQLRDRFVSETGLRNTDLERRVMEVVNAAEDDIQQGLISVGRPEAAQAWQEASRAAAARYEVIETAIEPVIGKNAEASGEQVMQRLNALARGNNARLGVFMASLPDADARTVRATIINQLGRASPGSQDASGQAFSLNQFLTHWNQLTPGAKRTLFDGETRAALTDLATVAEGAKAAGQYANHSNTARALGVQGLLGALGFGAGGPVGVAKVAGLQYLSGRLIASPRFARWLAKAPRAKTAAQRQAHIARLSGIARAEPAIAGDILHLQERLANAFAGSPSPAVANPASPSADTRQPASATIAGAPR